MKYKCVVKNNGVFQYEWDQESLWDARRFVENFGGIMEVGDSIEIVEVV